VWPGATPSIGTTSATIACPHCAFSTHQPHPVATSVATATGVTPSGRWRRANARIARIANARTDGLHQLTAAPSDRFSVIVEDLDVAGMLTNHRLARRISAAGWGELRRQLEYKSRDRGGRLVVADRFYPSSKTCSACGAVKTKLRPSQRIYDCDSCSISIDRDINAAANLAALAASTAVTSSPSCGATTNEPTGNTHKTSIAAASTATGSPPRTTPHEQSHGSC
jgi:putative transposase